MTRRARINLGMAVLVAGLALGAVSGVGTTAVAAAASGPPSPPPALQAEAQAAALAAAQQGGGQSGTSGSSGSSGSVVSPDVQEPINTVLGPYVTFGCEMYAEFGNIYGVAYGKSEVYFDGSPDCGVSDYILAYSNGDYAWGNVASAGGDQGWTNPQSQVDGYDVVSEYVTVCNETECAYYEFDAV